MIVTTTTNAGPAERARAELVAARCGARLVRRRGPVEGLAYVVGRDRDHLLDGELRLSVDLGLLHARRAAGADHPLIRAIGPARRVIDATLGLAGDALHIAEVLGAEVVGIEASPALYSLAEEGLPRLLRGGVAGAGRIHLVHADAREVLAELGPADAVVVDPMFEAEQAAAPGFELLRQVARFDRFDDAWLTAALVAAPRVVVKAPRGAPVAAGAAVVPGRAIDWRVHERR